MENSLFPFTTMKSLVDDLFQPKPMLYWIDFLLSASLAWGLFLTVELQDTLNLVQYTAFLLSSIFFYRSMLFIHEISHRKRSELPYFSLVWNLVIGIPALFPSFMYRGVHSDHHKKNNYGTKGDGEYLPFGAEAPWKILFFIAQSFLLPLLVVIRFGLIAPLSLLHPKLRLYVMERMSSLAIDFSAKREIPSKKIDLQNWYVQEFLCFAHVALMTTLYVKHVIPGSTFRHIYLLIVLLFIINSLRTLVAHRYNNTGAIMSFNEQLVDSVNVEGPMIFTETWAPVGLRYHGLHHLFPMMPYHNLYEAHRRLIKNLPENSSYHQTVEYGLWSALKHLWDHASESNKVRVQKESSSL